MAKSKFTKNVVPLHINGMDGRMLCLPAPKNRKREILLIYGHHASLERMSGIADVLNRYGRVTIPDLPGFGGMDSFYKINRTPTLDAYADYLAAFIKLYYKRKRITVIAMSFSFIVVTRMLQKYPELAKKIDLLVSFVGFVHKDDFRFSRPSYWSLRLIARVFSFRLPALLLRYAGFNRYSLKLAYRIVASSNTKMLDADKDEFKKRVMFETELWQINDVRSRMKTMTMMFKADLCKQQVKLPVKHVSVPDDRYFNNKLVEQHMRIVFTDFEDIPCLIKGHMPTVVATAKEAAPFVPPRVRRLLLKKS